MGLHNPSPLYHQHKNLHPSCSMHKIECLWCHHLRGRENPAAQESCRSRGSILPQGERLPAVAGAPTPMKGKGRGFRRLHGVWLDMFSGGVRGIPVSSPCWLLNGLCNIVLLSTCFGFSAQMNEWTFFIPYAATNCTIGRNATVSN